MNGKIQCPMNVKGVCQAECADTCEYSDKCSPLKDDDPYLDFRSLNDCGNIHLKLEEKLNKFIYTTDGEINKLISYDRLQDGELARLAGITNTYDKIPEKEIRFLIDLLRGIPEGSLMIAKEKEHFYDVFKRIFGISELEKKIIALETYKQQLRAFDSFKNHEERIEKLENEYIINSIPAEIYKKDQSKISELEKKQKEGWKNIKKLFYSLLEDTEKPLKERNEKLEKSLLDLESLVKQNIDTRLQLVEEGFNAKLLELSELKVCISDNHQQHGKHIEQQRKELDELKEQIGGEKSVLSCGWTPQNPHCEHTDEEPPKLETKFCQTCNQQMWLEMSSLSTGVWRCECGEWEGYTKEETVILTPKQIIDILTNEPKEKPPEPNAGSARQTDYIKWIYTESHLNCLENFRIVLKDDILVEKAELEFIFSKDPEFMNMEELKRRRKIKEKYLGGDDKG